MAPQTEKPRRTKHQTWHGETGAFDGWHRILILIWYES